MNLKVGLQEIESKCPDKLIVGRLNRGTCLNINSIRNKLDALSLKDIFAGFIAKDFNCVDIGVFPDDLNHADITTIYKKKNKSDKTNYMPVIILPNISKIYEKLIYNQLYDYFDDILSTSQCGFRKGHSTQHCLFVILEKFKEFVDKGNEFGALLTDLSKPFDCIDHKLLKVH